MSSVIDMDELFDEATGVPPEAPKPAAGYALHAVPATTKELEELLNVQLPGVHRSALSLERLRLEAKQVDGRIIGTGEADFTKGNTFYSLNYKGKTFQLVDVPGIEGDESKYAEMVGQAIAKAHLVFYVNGTNKKPETQTAEKIRSYLRRGTQVCPLVNVRGSADAYEFDEDRESLDAQGSAADALQQTMGVLQSVLGKEVLLTGHCVQGLLAFSSLAVQSATGKTSIHPSRDRDLVIQQRNYLKYFKSARAMFDFSRLEAVAKVLHTKLGTFKEDIIESNKVKVRELLTENIAVLEKALKEHKAFLAKIHPEFEKCRESIEQALRTFERLIANGRRNLWNDFFNTLSEKADDIVAEHFGENDRIAAKIKKEFRSRQEEIDAQLQEQLDAQMTALQEDISRAMERLVQDVQRVAFQQRFSVDGGARKASYQVAEMDMGLEWKDVGRIAFNVGSYALTGAGIGSAFPGIGTAIGAIAGAVVGVLVSALGWFTSKEKRIRKAQGQVQERIDEVRDEVMGRIDDEISKIVTSVRKEVEDATLKQVNRIQASLSRPLDIITQQLALMINIKDQLKKMPYGTIQAIQR